MKKIHYLYFGIFFSLTFPVLATPQGLDKSVEKENKINLQRDLRVDTKKDLKIETSSPKEKLNLSKTYKEENSTPSREIKRSEFGNQKPCTQTLLMMEKRIEVMEQNLQKRKELKERILEKLNSRIQTLKSSGIDTSKVEESLSEYVSQTDNVLKQREGLIMVLADLTRFDCGGDSVNFKNNLKDFNQRFKNQNLEFNRINKEFRIKVLYELNNLIEKASTPETTSSNE